ncbi:energy transducer TonB [Acidobacteria bacterium AB60]|nr:energy transducer TonB [Acidobacteria bacterium AB60]
MFEDATFESTGRIHTRSRRWMLATFALNAAILAALILIPLIYPEALPNRFISILLTAPPPPPAPQPPPQQVATRAFHGTREYTDLNLSVPTRIPTTITRMEGIEAPPGNQTISMDQGGPSLSGGDPFGHTAQPAVHLAPKPTGPAHISSGVAAGLLLRKVLPVYPPIARAARVEGAVVLAAIIASDGSIQNLRVVSGPPMLQQAALDAVQQWRYRPYLLNGDPVAVETTINVVFSLGH